MENTENISEAGELLSLTINLPREQRDTESVKCNVDVARNVKLIPSGLVELSDSQGPLECSAVKGAVFQATWEGNFPSLNLDGSIEVKSAEFNNRCDHNHSHIPQGPGKKYSSRPPPDSSNSKLTFKDCGGLEKQVKFLQTAVLQPIKNQNASQNPFKRFGLEPPKGILFHGPPGTGKTRLAQALGNELGYTFGTKVHFIYRKGQDVASKYFGQSSYNLKAVFEEAKTMQPTIIFFDELDGLCPCRNKPFMNQSNITIVTTMLGLMDELPRGRIFVIAATNRLEAVDSAMRRPGRFDKYLEFLPPDTPGRFDILNIHTKNWKIKPEKDLLRRVSEQTSGFSGADLSKLAMDAFDQAMRRLLSSDDNKSKELSHVDFGTLSVTEGDWNAALGKMNPSESAVFGSNLYTPKQGFGTHVDPLVQGDVEQITVALAKKFPINSDAESSISTFYVWSKTKSVLGNIDDFIISKVLISEQLGQYPVYCLSPVVLYSKPVNFWPKKVNDVFNQALGARSAILYLQNVDELGNMIPQCRMSLAINIKHHLERLRGSSVIVLASGSMKLQDFPQDNAFKELFSESEDKCYEIHTPSTAEREGFFAPLFAGILIESDEQWANEDVVDLTEVFNLAVNVTANNEIAKILILYDMIAESHANNANSKKSKQILIKELTDVVGDYTLKMKRLRRS